MTFLVKPAMTPGEEKERLKRKTEAMPAKNHGPPGEQVGVRFVVTKRLKDKERRAYSRKRERGHDYRREELWRSWTTSEQEETKG